MKAFLPIFVFLSLAACSAGEKSIPISAAERLEIRELQLVVTQAALAGQQAAQQFEAARKASDEGQKKLQAKLEAVKKAHKCADCVFLQEDLSLNKPDKK